MSNVIFIGADGLALGTSFLGVADGLALGTSFLGVADGLALGTSFLDVSSCPGVLALEGMMILHDYEVRLEFQIVSLGILDTTVFAKAGRNGTRSNRVG